MEVKTKPAFWKDKKVLITGYEGFLGSHLTRALIGMGAKVIGLDIKTRRKETILKDELRRVRIIRGSVQNFSLVSSIIKDNRVKVVFHLAATSIVGEALRKPLSAYKTNIEGTWNMLEASRKCKTVESVIIASSDKAYGIQNKLPYREDSSLSGCHPYDASKSCADLLAYTYYRTYSLPVSVTRCGNIFGPGDFNFSRIIPDALRSIILGRTLMIRSDGKFIRDYIYVDDIVRGYLMLAEQLKAKMLSGEAFNFSDQRPISVIELVKNIYRIAGKMPDYKVLNRAKYEIRKQFLSSAKANRILGWKARYSLEGGLIKTLSWYKDYFKNR